MANQKKIKQAQRQYNKLYNKLELYSEAPLTPIKNPKTKDIKRLQYRWETVNEYQKIYNRYKKSIIGFNEKYLQNISIPKPHDTKNKRTLKTLQRRYEEWKRYRRNFVRRVANEPENIERNLRNYFNYVRSSFTPNSVTGEYSINDQRMMTHANVLDDIVDEILGDDPDERRVRLRRIKSEWNHVEELMDIIIYNSENAQAIDIEEAWAELYFIITKDGLKKGDGFDIIQRFREAYEYE